MRGSGRCWTRCFGVCLIWAGTAAEALAEPRPQQGIPSEVRVVQSIDSNWTLEVNGEPLLVRGAGAGGASLAELAAIGGNAIRTWQGDRAGGRGNSQLDAALQAGLFVAFGLEVGSERHGFDYGDERAVARQLDRLRTQVQRHRKHPALLLWVVGNELNLEARDPRVWDALNDIVLMIQREDPAHPALTPLAGIDASVISELKQRAPALKLLGMQLYGGISRLPDLRAAGWDGPYLITEWGPTGHWETPVTPWGAPIEESSEDKALKLLQRYRESVLADRSHALGSFVFLWGHKQERTPTWYGMFLDTGEATAAVDAMQLLWTGAPPERSAPVVGRLRMEGRLAIDGVSVGPGASVKAEVDARAMSGSALSFQWQVREESRAVSIGGDREVVPARARVRIVEPAPGLVEFNAPRRSGEYRLFVTVRDEHGKAGHANLPFQVGKKRRK